MLPFGIVLNAIRRLRPWPNQAHVAAQHIPQLRQFRDAAALPALAAALRDPDGRVWKEALDGIVTLGGPPALEVLQAARAALETFTDAEVRQQWIDEAVEQVKEAQPG